METIGKRFDALVQDDALEPLGRDTVDAVDGAGLLLVDRARGVRVIAEVDRNQGAIAERLRGVQRPQRRLEGVTAAKDRPGLQSPLLVGEVRHDGLAVVADVSVFERSRTMTVVVVDRSHEHKRTGVLCQFALQLSPGALSVDSRDLADDIVGLVRAAELMSNHVAAVDLFLAALLELLVVHAGAVPLPVVVPDMSEDTDHAGCCLARASGVEQVGKPIVVGERD